MFIRGIFFFSFIIFLYRFCFVVLAVDFIVINFFYVCVKLVSFEMDFRFVGFRFFFMELSGGCELSCYEGG